MTADETIREVIAHIAACDGTGMPLSRVRVTHSHGAEEGRLRVRVRDDFEGARCNYREAILHPDDWGRVIDLVVEIQEPLGDDAAADVVVPEAKPMLCGVPIVVEDDAI
jgi:hypothetical protein